MPLGEILIQMGKGKLLVIQDVLVLDTFASMLASVDSLVFLCKREKGVQYYPHVQVLTKYLCHV